MKVKNILCALLCICLLSGCLYARKTKIELTVDNIFEYVSFNTTDIEFGDTFDMSGIYGNTSYSYSVSAKGNVKVKPKKNYRLENVVISGEAVVMDAEWRDSRYGKEASGDFTIEVSPGAREEVVFHKFQSITDPLPPKPEVIFYSIKEVSGYAIV